MADNRRTPRRGAAAGNGGSPRGRTGPGREPGRRSRPSAAGARPTGEQAAVRPRSRLTGRAAILVLVLAVLAVSYASSLRAFLDQRAHIKGLQEQISERQAAIEELEREKRRWDDPAYVEQQARERLGYVMPGETSYVALDEHGEPIERQAELTDPDTVDPKEPTAWWADAWGSVEAAGHPPKADPPPLTRIEPSKEDSE